jgi:hypothetical protein
LNRTRQRSGTVDSYEIRIVKKRGNGPVIYACALVSDHAAIRRAQSLVEDGDLVEVWRGLDCVYFRGGESGTHHGSA